MLRHELVNAWQYYDGFAEHYEKMAHEIMKQIREVDDRLALYQQAERWINTNVEPDVSSAATEEGKSKPKRFFEICS
jgi:hypothetical protein